MSDFKAIKCTEFDFHWGPAPYPTGVDLIAVFKGPTSNGRDGRQGEDRAKKGWEGCPPNWGLWI